MECNRDEAERAKEIAKKKFEQKDFNGAKRFALKAQTLFPPLDGISLFITTIDVHLMAESIVGDEKDWYAIMSLSPSADDSTLKKQYKHLVLQLHPDKNKFPGAECAFKLVTNAFNVLKDKSKRQMFDKKRKTHTMKVQKMGGSCSGSSNGFNNPGKGAGFDMRAKFQAQGAPQRPTGPVPWPPPSTNGCSAKGAPNIAKGPVPRPPPSSAGCNAKGAPQAARPVSRPQKPRSTSCSAQGASQAATQPVQQPPNQKTASCSAQGNSEHHVPGATTFWTRCTSCRMWFEYSLIFLNKNLKCPCCTKVFVAADAGRPVSRYNFEEMQAWKRANLGPSNPGSSANVNAGSDDRDQYRFCKRMRGEGSKSAN
ncbi:hypothetical protein LUZ63_003707 [Rhynchospora breviuscula]|uniref:J domain-containing protein n=1 Tax=Rhynchospora breviuscula TaxID=2022672 RepID=A0A9Q0D180_9POAL|nr:hypothetical protein LUZ63_003707 [Rhynchospora breviuscula]